MKRIGVLLWNSHEPFWREIMRTYAELADPYGFDVTFHEAEPMNSCEAQLELLDKIINQEDRYDAIIINPISRANLLPAIRKSWVPIFDVGPKCDPAIAGEKNYYPVFVTDFVEQGRISCEALVAALPPHPSGWAVIIGGVRDARHSDDRCRGAFEALRTVFPPERILTVYADFLYEHARGFVEDFIRLFDNVQAIFCASDTMALGALQAVEIMEPKIVPIVAGVDATTEALESIKNGKLYCTSGLANDSIVKCVYEAVVNALRGMPIPMIPMLRSKLFI